MKCFFLAQEHTLQSSFYLDFITCLSCFLGSWFSNFGSVFVFCFCFFLSYPLPSQYSPFWLNQNVSIVYEQGFISGTVVVFCYFSFGLCIVLLLLLFFDVFALFGVVLSYKSYFLDEHISFCQSWKEARRVCINTMSICYSLVKFNFIHTSE